ncbi:hypothetical protein HBH70_213420 [Parastagonospora nodorum]|nr:hypothetical protein HBH51_141660 [Parastagonospora nodorum]KAH4050645.1 hypothetical protein HBH49_121330 [Parastagonospora nodorum]KAH4090549.1 hypothetical protein HBH48_096250 [Parastagonospora nodorum]KAH4091901.1 hypothetical protein HBH46_183500 [Parastagonospora nodorum]KAH4148113.1 hypothetical protein HBH44_214350 [Parastagonospora nodorum]
MGSFQHRRKGIGEQHLFLGQNVTVLLEALTFLTLHLLLFVSSIPQLDVLPRIRDDALCFGFALGKALLHEAIS